MSTYHLFITALNTIAKIWNQQMLAQMNGEILCNAGTMKSCVISVTCLEMEDIC